MVLIHNEKVFDYCLAFGNLLENIPGTNQEKYKNCGIQFGLTLRKGFFFSYTTGKTLQSFSKDGMKSYISQYHEFCYLFFLVHFISILDTITYPIVGCLGLVIFALIFLLNFLFLLMMSPYLICCCGCVEPSDFIKRRWRCVTGSIASIFVILFSFILLPIHCVLPEFTVGLLKMNRWGIRLKYCGSQ